MKSYLRLVLCFLALQSGFAAAKMWCVSSSDELQAALAASAAEAGSDEIRIAEGLFAAPAPQGFVHVATRPGGLILSGGWTRLPGAPSTCGEQAHDPALTVLDAAYQHQVLSIFFADPAEGNVAVSNLTLAHGTTQGSGGGLKIHSDDPQWQGEVLLFSLRFLANEAGASGAGLWVSVPHGWLRLLNSVFAGNGSEQSGAAADVIGNGAGVLVANVTAAYNSAGLPEGAALRIAGAAPATLMNSVLWNGGSVDLELAGSEVRLLRNFLETRTGEPALFEDATLSGDPQLGGGSLGLTPSAGSPLRDHGVPVPHGMPAWDIDGGRRLVGQALDPGAFEMQVFADGYESDDPWDRPPNFIEE